MKHATHYLCLFVGAFSAPISWCLAGGNEGASLSLSTADAPPLFDLADTAGGTGEGTKAAVSTTTDHHPGWVRDLEQKTWKGFLTGLGGYEDFIKPVGMPLYFEDPFITTDIRVLYVYHRIGRDSVLRGGQVHVAAAEIRVALAERLALIATKDGYSWVDSHITPAGDGWNDIAIGLKYALYTDPASHFLVSTGFRWEWTNGSTDAWQGGDSQEISPFVSVAKGWDKWHFLGAFSGRVQTDHNDANHSLVWNLHLDYELTETFRPLVELHGIHWVSDADRLPIGADYLDVGSLGASDVAGRDFFAVGAGFRWQICPNVSFGLTGEIPIENSSEDLEQYRLTMNTVISF